MRAELTDRQKQVLDTLVEFRDEHGYPPSVRELMPLLGVSSLRGVTVHLDALKRKGWIERGRTSRSIRVIAPKSIEIPLLDTLASRRDDVFTITVNGDSLVGEHILDGDTVIVRKGTDPQPGGLVVCTVGGTQVVKRLDPREDLEVVGKIIVLVRGLQPKK